MAFTPKSKNSIKEEIRNILLSGQIIRYDFREDMPLEVLDRKYIKDLPKMSNIGQCSKPIAKKIDCNHKVLHEIKAELEKDYSVRAIRCEYSGCCQYTTYGLYIE